MNEIPIYQVDAFTSEVFGGNPAAVCPLDAWLPPATMQAIAAENNLSETAFFVADGGGYQLRWFTPTTEVPLCGHATLASAYVIAEHLNRGVENMQFETASGPLVVTRSGEGFTLDFPALAPEPFDDKGAVAQALGLRPQAVLRAVTMMAVMASEAEVRDVEPHLERVKHLPADGLIVTAPGDPKGPAACDFVSRYFAPHAGIPEDPVTGSAHCTLTPYWADRLGKSQMAARQISARGGELTVALEGDRVLISGRVAPYLKGRIRV